MPKRVVGPEASGQPSRRAPAAPMPGPPIHVVVAEERRAVAEALAEALARDGRLQVEIALSVSEAVRAAGRARSGVLFLDLGLPGPGAVDSIRQVRESAPGVAVVAMSSSEEDLVRAKVLEAGAAGFVSRTTPLGELSAIVREAAAGRSLIGPDDEARLFRLLRRQRHQESTERQRVNRLTTRQLEVLQLTADGVSPGEIAERLRMSPLTLRTHMQNILTRLGVHTKLEAVTVAIRHGKLKSQA